LREYRRADSGAEQKFLETTVPSTEFAEYEEYPVVTEQSGCACDRTGGFVGALASHHPTSLFSLYCAALWGRVVPSCESSIGQETSD
jgi:hypothetical protein